jgi:MFS family permease
MAALSSWAGRLSDRIGSRAPATAGMAIVAAGMSFPAFMPSHASTARVMLSLAVVGVGMAAFSTPSTSAVMGSVDRSRLGVASAFVGTTRFTGQALSVAALGGIAASQLGSAASKVLLLGGPVAATGGAARAAAAIAAAHYADGYRWAMLVGAVLALIGAAVSLVRPSQTSAL